MSIIQIKLFVCTPPR